MDADVLSDRLLKYAARVMDVVEALPSKKTATHCGNQLLRCGTSPGANYEEARAAESRDDFIHKCGIVLKELRESRYWIRLVDRRKYVRPGSLATLLQESLELVLIFSKSISTARSSRKS